jgi:hypothetical protein
MRWVLVIWLSFGPGTVAQPIAILQSTEASCTQAADKLRGDLAKQRTEATVVTACLDRGFAY